MDENLLENLASNFCSRFIKVINNSDNRGLNKLIGLYGADESTLNSLKDNMQRYFLNEKQEIEIVFGKKGYEIDVGYFLENSQFNTALQRA